MKREPHRLADSQFDLAVIGAGIYGACIARDAAMRGLRVALIDRGDFGGATSHHSLKLIHGGIRYLQTLDLSRLLESASEQCYWLWAAPHLVRPLPFILPTRGWGARSRYAVGLALAAYGLLSSRCSVNGVAMPAGRVLSRDACLAALPGLNDQTISGGMLWHDLQMLEADRLLLECVQQAVAFGATACNYIAAQSLQQDQGVIRGVLCRDQLEGDTFSVRASLTINACGPYADQLLAGSNPLTPALARCTNVVVGDLGLSRGFGLPAGDGKRLYFVAPWKDCTLIGTINHAYEEDPDSLVTDQSEVVRLIGEVNAAWPSAQLREDQVRYHYTGLLPAEGGTGVDVRLARRGRLIDHWRRDHVRGLISVIGEKYTTARSMAERVVDLALARLDLGRRPCRVLQTRLPGAGLSVAPECVEESAAWFRERCRQAIKHEMVMRLDDLLLRRTDLAVRGQLSPLLLHWAADTAATSLNWSPTRKRQELERLRRLVPSLSIGPEMGQVV